MWPAAQRDLRFRSRWRGAPADDDQLDAHHGGLTQELGAVGAVPLGADGLGGLGLREQKRRVSMRRGREFWRGMSRGRARGQRRSGQGAPAAAQHCQGHYWAVAPTLGAALAVPFLAACTSSAFLLMSEAIFAACCGCGCGCGRNSESTLEGALGAVLCRELSLMDSRSRARSDWPVPRGGVKPGWPGSGVSDNLPTFS